MIDEKKALDLIAQGEGQHVEFKESVPSKVRELSEEVCAFSNASGGYVFIGVNNKSEFIKGFTIDNTKCVRCGVCMDHCSFDAIYID